MSWCFYTKDILHTASSVIEYAHFQIYQIMPITYSPVLESQALLLCDSANTKGRFTPLLLVLTCFVLLETGSQFVTPLSSSYLAHPCADPHYRRMSPLWDSFSCFSCPLTWYCGHLCFHSGSNHSLIKNEILLGLVAQAHNASTQKAEARGL